MARRYKAMEKSLSLFITSIILLFLIFSSISVLAQKDLEVEYPSIPGVETPETTQTHLSVFLKYIYNFAIFIAGFLAFILLIWAGIRYITSAGRPAQLKEAKKQITASFLGLIIIFSSYLILNTINPQFVIFHLPGISPIEIEDFEIPSGVDVPPIKYQEIPVGTLVTSEIDVSSFIAPDSVTTDPEDPDTALEEYGDAFPDTATYQTDYQGGLHGRRLKRIHEIASTTLPVVKMLADLSGELADLETKLKNTNGELVTEAIKCSCFLHCDRPCDFGLTALAGIFQGNIDSVDDFDDVSDLFNFDVSNLIEGLDIMDIIWDFVSCVGPCRGDCSCSGDPCPNREKMNKLREETIPAFYEENGPIPCKIVEIQYLSAAFKPFLDGSSQLVKNEDYQIQSFWYSQEAEKLRAEIKACIDAGSESWEKAGLTREDYEKIEKQFEEMEDLIDLMAEVENKGTYTPKTDPPERDIETSFYNLTVNLMFLELSKKILNPEHPAGCFPQPYSFLQFYQVADSLGLSKEELKSEPVGDIRVGEDPATFYCSLGPFESTRETLLLEDMPPDTICDPMVEIPIGKTIDEALKLMENILRELGDPEGLGEEGIWNMGHLIIDDLLLAQIKLSEKTFGLSDDLIDLTTEDECGMCDEECQAHCFEIKLPTPVGAADVAHICYCTGIPCPLVEIILKWANLVFNVGTINKLYDNPGEPIDSVFEAKERIYESFYKFNSEYPDKDPEHPNGHPDAGDRVPIGEDICCNDPEGHCRDPNTKEFIFSDSKAEKRKYTLNEKLIYIQRLLNMSRDVKNYIVLLEELIEMDLAEPEELVTVYNTMGSRADLSDCDVLITDLGQQAEAGLAQNVLENCWLAGIYNFKHIYGEICSVDPPYDCEYFDETVPEKKRPLLCYCFNDAFYPKVASNFFCCSLRQSTGE